MIQILFAIRFRLHYWEEKSALQNERARVSGYFEGKNVELWEFTVNAFCSTDMPEVPELTFNIVFNINIMMSFSARSYTRLQSNDNSYSYSCLQTGHHHLSQPSSLLLEEASTTSSSSEDNQRMVALPLHFLGADSRSGGRGGGT